MGGEAGKEFASGSPRIGYTRFVVMCRDGWAELSCPAACGFPSSVGIRQQSLSPTVGALFTDTILAKTSAVIEQKNFVLPCLLL